MAYSATAEHTATARSTYRGTAVLTLVVAIAVVVLVGCSGAREDVSSSVEAADDGQAGTSTSESNGGSTRPGGLPEIPVLEPIAGYGDFSAMAYWEVDWFEVTALMVRCANDNGIAARILPPGDGLSLAGVTPDQHVNARAVLDGLPGRIEPAPSGTTARGVPRGDLRQADRREALPRG